MLFIAGELHDPAML